MYLYLFTSVCIYLSINLCLSLSHSLSLYIYIYTPDYFVVSQLFRVARHAKCFKLGSKLAYFTPVEYFTADIVIISVIKGIFTYIFTRSRPPGCSVHAKSFVFALKWQPEIPRSSAQHPGGGAYTLSSTDCFFVLQLISEARHPYIYIYI